MDSNEAKEIKTILTSLMISNPRKCTVQQLWTDFYDMEGRVIPLKKLGFVTFEAYLQSIPDVVKIIGSGPNAFLEHVTSEKSEHIQQMILKQKKNKVKRPSNRTHFRHPRYHNPNRKTGYHSSNRKTSTPFSENRRHKPKVTNTVPIQCAVKKSEVIIDNKNQFSESKETKLPPKINNYSQEMESKQFHASRNSVDVDFLFSVLTTNAKDNLKQKSQTHSILEIPACSIDEKPCKSRIPLKVQSNLQTLIKNFPNGINCSKLPEEYHNLFGKNVYYEDFGYRSLIEMCSDLPDIFHYTRESSDDYLLFDKDKPLEIINKTDFELRTSTPESENISKTHILEELSDSKWSSSLLPADVVTIDDEIYRFFPADVKVNDILEISVAEIFDLSKFWLYITFGDLGNLMNNLQIFFYENHDTYLIPEFFLTEGLYCVSLYTGLYHRCVIVDTLPKIPQTIRVFFIDYGTVTNVSTKHMWFLPKKFSTIPCQAIRARLANIYPIYENRPWTAAAISKFAKLIVNRVLVAKITKIHEKDHVLDVYLADITNKDDIFYINDKLVTEGYALYAGQERKKVPIDDDCCPNVQYIHLYPEFHEIEAGMAPVVNELKYLINNKIPLHQFIPQYFNIYYTECIDNIQKRHKKLIEEKITDFDISNTELEEFDFSLFSDSVKNFVQDIYEQDIISRKNNPRNTYKTNLNESFKEYSCNKKRISELINSINLETSDETESDFSNFNCDVKIREPKESNFCLEKNNLNQDSKVENLLLQNSECKNNPDESVKEYFCNKRRIAEFIHNHTESVESINPNSLFDENSFNETSSDISNVERFTDIDSLNNSFQKFDIKSDSLNSSQNSNNPFWNSLNNTNPFRSTNPFLNTLEETVNSNELLDLFSKPISELSPKKNVNNLKESHVCVCKTNKQVNIDKSIRLIKTEVADNTTSADTVRVSEVESPNKGKSENKRPRTPPGFNSRNCVNRVSAGFIPNTVNFVANNNAYYPSLLPYQFNSNIFFNQPPMENYFNLINGLYSNQFNGRAYNWQQWYSSQNFYPSPR